jgi:hypothetical protein
MPRRLGANKPFREVAEAERFLAGSVGVRIVAPYASDLLFAIELNELLKPGKA